DRVHVDVRKNGRLVYKIAVGGETQTLNDDSMLHIPGPLSDDGYTGRSVIQTFRETLGLGLALERYSGEFFGNGAAPSGVFVHPGQLSPTAHANLKKELDEKHTGRGQRHRLLLLEEGVKFEAIGVSHEESQFIESRRFSTEEIARIFGVPPYMI